MKEVPQASADRTGIAGARCDRVFGSMGFRDVPGHSTSLRDAKDALDCSLPL
jgi:hypothetical protein